MPSLKQSFVEIKSIVTGKAELGPVKIAGWIRTRRGSKKFSFIELNDGTSAHSIQVVADGNLNNYEEVVRKLTTGCAIAVTGKLVKSQGQGQAFEVQASEVELLGDAKPEEYFIQKKRMTFEYLREHAHMRMRTALYSSVFRIRSKASQAIHRFFEDNGYEYVHTPLLTTSDGEGAGEMFQVTTQNLDQLAKMKEGAVDYSKDFFGEQVGLCVTGQLEAELMMAGLGKVYTFGPAFRAENSNTARHLAELWMIEPEAAFANLADMMDLGEGFLRTVAKEILEKCDQDLQILSSRADYESKTVLLDALQKENWPRITYTEAIDILKKANKPFEETPEWGIDLGTEHERFLAEEHFGSPVFVTDYPKEFKAFYMYQNDDGKTVAASDLLVPRIGEVIGGSQREHRLDKLLEGMQRFDIPREEMQWYIDSRKFGTVPHAGFGLGLDRLIMWLTGMHNIRDTIPFPRTPGQCKF